MLHAASGVYFGGGNTYLLLRELRRAGVFDVMPSLIADGLAVYGGSAGAVVLGADTSIAAHADPNDVGLKDLRGIDAVGGRSILPHYTDDDLPLAEEWVATHGGELLLLPEAGGAIVEGPVLVGVGDESPLLLSTRGLSAVPARS